MRRRGEDNYQKTKDVTREMKIRGYQREKNLFSCSMESEGNLLGDQGKILESKGNYQKIKGNLCIMLQSCSTMLHRHAKMIPVSCPYPCLYPYSCNIANYLCTYISKCLYPVSISCSYLCNIAHVVISNSLLISHKTLS